MDDEIIEAKVKELLTANDIEGTLMYVTEQFDNYSGNLIEKSLEIAREVGCQGYIDGSGL
jgi:hypothetical protein